MTAGSKRIADDQDNWESEKPFSYSRRVCHFQLPMDHQLISRRHALKTALLGGAGFAAASRFGLLLGAEDTSAVPSVTPRLIDWEKDWDPAVGLWWKKGPGHTEGTHQYERLHALPNAAVRLHYFAMHHSLDE